MNCSRLSALENLASALHSGAALELYLTPKPGLVDCFDSGSHPDLTLVLMERSLGHVADYLGEIVASLNNDEAFSSQQAIAIRAERHLLEQLGTNTHKGYLFLAGMLLIAIWHARSPDERTVRKTLSMLAETFFQTNERLATHGQLARASFSTGGIVLEAIKGYPSLFDEALPVYRAIRAAGGNHDDASFAMLARLMRTVDDTTTLHRGGLAGLARIRRDGCRLEQIVGNGDDYLPFLAELNRTYVRLNLTIGGVADMLGIGYGWMIAAGEIVADRETFDVPLVKAA